MNLSRRQRIVLGLLRGAGTPMWGRDIVALSGGVISRGRVYLILERLEDHGFVEVIQDGAATVFGIQRLMYRITPFGERALDTPARPWWKFW